MDRVNDPEWQKKHKSFAHIPPNQVFNSFQAYIESLDIRGQSRLAQLLTDRVDLGLCEKYPQLLLVVKALAGPLDSPVLLPMASKEPTWAEILQQEPLTGDHWIEPIYYSDEDSRVTNKPESPDAAPFSEFHRPEFHRPDCTELQIPDLPNSLDQKQVVEEIKHQLLGYDTLLPYSLAGFPQNALESVLAQVDQLAEITSSIRLVCKHPFAGNAFTQLNRDLTTKINYHVPTTILGAMVYFKQLLVPFGYIKSLPQEYTKMLDHLYTFPIFASVAEPFRAQISAWTSTGSLGPLLSVYQPTLLEMVQDHFEISLPHFIDNKAVINAGKYAVFATSLGLNPGFVSLVMDYSLEIQISQLERRNLHDLLQLLKPKLAAEWQRIAPVYLVQDARLVEFVLNCAADRGFSRGDAATVAAILAVQWPDYPFKMMRDCVPEFENTAPLLHLLLPIDQLKNQWLATIDTMIRNLQNPSEETHNLLLEFEAYNQHTMQTVASKIAALDEIVPLKLPK